MPSKGALIFLAFGALLFLGTHAENILLLPIPYPSCVMQFTSIGNKLAERGHNVTMVLTPSSPGFKHAKENGKFTVLGYAIVEKDYFEHEDNQFNIENLMKISFLDLFINLMDPAMPVCSNMMQDEELFEKLRQVKFSIAMVYSDVESRCFWILPYRLDIPYVSMALFLDPIFQRVPAVPSFVPLVHAEIYTEHMSIWERFHNMWLIVKWAVAIPNIGILSDKFFESLTPDRPFLNVHELAAKSELWFVHSDVLLDYPRPTMPNEVFVGGILTGKSGKLDHELQSFMDSAENGVIIMSFGTNDALSGHYLDKFINAFKNVDQNVILRTTHVRDETSLSKNIKMMEWIPQNDLLGHVNTKLFITHCGTNSQYEALYHAVPMIGFPVFFDQRYNARRVEYHGYGTYLDITTFTPDDLIVAIDEMYRNTSYKENIAKASKIFRGRPKHPLDRVADYLEFIIEFGGDHLKSYPALNLAWYEYLMLDIVGIICAVFISVSILISGILWCILHRKLGMKKENTKKTQ